MPSCRAISALDSPASRSRCTRRRVTMCWLVDILGLRVGGSSNGKTPASGAGYRGSSPCPPVGPASLVLPVEHMFARGADGASLYHLYQAVLQRVGWSG